MSRPTSRFMRSMTPSGSVKMSASRFNLVCGKTREMACLPNVDRIPNPQPPKVIDARVTTQTMGRREYGSRRDRSVSREVRAPVPPARESSLYLPFGSYADLGCHTKPPSRWFINTWRFIKHGYSLYREMHNTWKFIKQGYLLDMECISHGDTLNTDINMEIH